MAPAVDPYKLAGGPTPLLYISKSPMEATADIHILPGFAGYAQKISIQVSTSSARVPCMLPVDKANEYYSCEYHKP